MPLSKAAAREKLHTRDIEICGYRRADGLYDIEAQLADAKSYGFVNQDRGYVDAGEKLHGMWLRLTVDEPADYELVRRVFEELYPANASFSAIDVLALLRQRPEWVLLNSAVRQKHPDEG